MISRLLREGKKWKSQNLSLFRKIISSKLTNKRIDRSVGFPGLLSLNV